MNSSLWNQVGEKLAESGYTAYAPEMLGLGYTEGSLDHDHSLLGQAHLFKRFIESMIPDESILVGHDLGGGTLQIMMTEFPGFVKKAVLTNCVGFDSWPIEDIKFIIRASQRPNYSKIFTPKFTTGFVQKGISGGLLNHTSLNESLVEDIVNGLIGNQERLDHFMKFLHLMDSQYTIQASAKLQNFTGNSLVVWAKDDKYQPVSVGKQIHNQLPKVAWREFSGSHFHPLEAADFVSIMLEWNKSLEEY
ncbi:MAG: alpha/beta fold hydrolase [Leptospiraceae bacterium]|nr:alpha/beta fold hydrolase [Leptospiraceae bacterium]